ncbi:protein of unknown function [Pseudodesulfovibrio profundus]|uniref:Uncharacterized protein n=1 Tax=Pseudodesulfovibrio profundus TaxID=57320 RepID=A0A2C8FCF4_9BACT|nr:protein of unknown function [Pseudodesulfovibrio profundus]
MLADDPEAVHNSIYVDRKIVSALEVSPDEGYKGDSLNGFFFFGKM